MLLLLFAGVASAQEQSRTYRVPFRSVNGMILLDGQLNGNPAVLLFDTGARTSIVDVHYAELEGLKLDPLRSRGSVGAEGTCVAWEVRLSLEHRSWLTRRVCVMDLSDVSRRIGVRIYGFVGQDILRGFSAVRIDYAANIVEFQK